MIAYLIQVHNRLEHLPRLLDWIYHPQNQYFFSFDSRSILSSDALRVMPARDNVHLIECPPCTWAGESLLMAMLEGTRAALDKSRDWTHIAYITESCFPLGSQEALHAHLSSHAAIGLQNFMFYSEPVTARSGVAGPYTGKFEVVLPTRSGVTVRSDVSLNEFFSNVQNSPIMWTDLRPSIHSSEVAPGIIHCRPLFPVESAARTSYFAKHPYRAGRSNCILSRASCEWLLSSAEALTCLEYVKTTMGPEETFFMTALMSHESPAASCTVPQSLHFREGGPESLDDRDLDTLKTCGRFFGRKLALTHTQAIYDWMETLRFRGSDRHVPHGSGPITLPSTTRRLIFEDHAVKAYYQDGESDFILITFGDLITPQDRFFAEGPVGKARLTCIGVVAKGGNWYPARSIRDLLQVTHGLTEPYTRRILYGGSMGGYAALKYSRAFQATVVLSLCPQWSLDAAECGRDPGWQEYFNDGMVGMGVTPHDLAGEIFVFSDAFDRLDDFHAQRIQSLAPTVNKINVPFVSHDVTSVFAGTGNLNELIRACCNQDLRSLRRMSRTLRRYTSSRVRHLLDRALTKHPSLIKIDPGDLEEVSEWADRNLTSSQRDLYGTVLRQKPADRDSSCSAANHRLPSFSMKGEVATWHDTHLIFNHTAGRVFHGTMTNTDHETAVTLGLVDRGLVVLFIEHSGRQLFLRDVDGRLVLADDPARFDKSLCCELEAAVVQNFVHLRSNNAYLCASQATGDVAFDRALASSWERFQIIDDVLGSGG